MPTICDLKIELKKKGIKGISGLNKAGLQSLLDGKKPPVKKENKKEDKTPPKRITMKEEQIPDNLKDKSYIFLKRKVEKIQNIASNPSSTPSEKIQAQKKLTSYKTAMKLAKDKQYKNKKKK